MFNASLEFMLKVKVFIIVTNYADKMKIIKYSRTEHFINCIYRD